MNKPDHSKGAKAQQQRRPLPPVEWSGKPIKPLAVIWGKPTLLQRLKWHLMGG